MSIGSSTARVEKQYSCGHHAEPITGQRTQYTETETPVTAVWDKRSCPRPEEECPWKKNGHQRTCCKCGTSSAPNYEKPPPRCLNPDIDSGTHLPGGGNAEEYPCKHNFCASCDPIPSRTFIANWDKDREAQRSKEEKAKAMRQKDISIGEGSWLATNLSIRTRGGEEKVEKMDSKPKDLKEEEESDDGSIGGAPLIVKGEQEDLKDQEESIDGSVGGAPLTVKGEEEVKEKKESPGGSRYRVPTSGKSKSSSK